MHAVAMRLGMGMGIALGALLGGQLLLENQNRAFLTSTCVNF